MSELLQEFVDSGNHKLRVDRAAGVIRGVKLLGLRSRNGRRYLETALAEAANLYEGAKVNVNHPKGHPLSPRDYQDRLGVISGVRLEPGEGLFGDLRFNPKHALSEQLIWDAEHAPANVGLSHNVLARTTQQNGEVVVEAITKVQSIDLVADPATTRGLFEQTAGRTDTRCGTDTPVRQSEPDGHDCPSCPWDRLTLEELEHQRPDLLEALNRGHAEKLAEFRRQLDELTVRNAAVARRERIVTLLQEHELPLPGSRSRDGSQVVSEQFVETLMKAADEDTVRRLVEERAALVRSASQWSTGRGRNSTRPVSRDQGIAEFGANGHSPRDAKEFAAAICGR